MTKRLNQEREQRLQPKRLEECKQKLESLGFVVTVHEPDMLTFEYKGNVIKHYPYSGWHTGKGIKDGRGFGKLLRQVEEKPIERTLKHLATLAKEVAHDHATT